MTKEEQENCEKLGRHYNVMTRDDAIEILKILKPNMKFSDLGWIYTKQALQMAISALEQEPRYWIDHNGHVTPIQQPCEDAISRADLGLTDFEIVMCNGDYKQALEMLIEKIQKAPPVTPIRPNIPKGKTARCIGCRFRKECCAEMESEE